MKKKLTDLIIVGQIAGAHGVRGDVRVRSYTAEPDALFTYGPLLNDAADALIDPVNVRSAKNSFIVTPRAARQKEAWDALKGTRLYVPRHVLPPTEEDEYYIEDLIGLSVFSGGADAAGRIKAVLNHGAGDLLEIALGAGTKPVLVPFTLDDVPTVDIANGRIIVSDLDLWIADGSEAVSEEP